MCRVVPCDQGGLCRKELCAGGQPQWTTSSELLSNEYVIPRVLCRTCVENGVFNKDCVTQADTNLHLLCAALRDSARLHLK